jgi:hypothetical protein
MWLVNCSDNMMKHAIRPSPVILCFLLFFLLIFAIFAQAHGINLPLGAEMKTLNQCVYQLQDYFDQR